MRALLFALSAALLLASPSALARGNDDDAPIPYPDDEKDDENERRKLPRRSDETPNIREESDYEQGERDETLAGYDDPNYGLGAELLSGLLLLDSSRGALVETRFAWGLRFTWEFGRVLPQETLRDALFADVTWAYAAIKDGTRDLFAESNYHYFTVAPAYGFPLGKKSAFAFYGQVGFGLGYQFSAIHIKEVETQIAGTKPLFQYGIGIRGRPALVANESVRISFRFELTRFRRGYMDDTFLGGSVGATF
jgi:hypothetical protein